MFRAWPLALLALVAGLLLSCELLPQAAAQKKPQPGKKGAATSAEALQTLPGFKVELLHRRLAKLG